MKLINLFLFMFLITVLSACGFHLRGTNGDNYKLPFERIYVKCDNVIICSQFTTIVQAESLATVESSPRNADVTIHLYNEQTNRDIAGFSSIGRVSAYLLTYQVNADVLDHGDLIGDQIQLNTKITMQYNDAMILSDQQEEAKFWDRLHGMAVEQLIRRLIHFKYRKYSLITNESQ